MLTTQLVPPYEAADAAFAYTKAGYISDMGVFDNVVGLVGQNLGSLSTQQVAKCLWACGKIYAWERSPELGINLHRMLCGSILFIGECTVQKDLQIGLQTSVVCSTG